MQSPTGSPFVPPQHPTQFISVGYVFGRFEPFPDPPIEKAARGNLQLKGGIKVEAAIPWRFWLKLTQDPSFEPENIYLWRVYPRTTKEGKLRELQLVKSIPIEGKTTLRHLPPNDLGIDQFLMRGCIAFLDEERTVIRIHRNFNPPKGKAKTYIWKPFLLTLSGNLSSQAEVGQFWEILCSRREESLNIEQAHLIAQECEISKPAQAQPKTRPQPQPTQSSIIMITGRKPEITVKFTERPNLPEQGKKVTLQVTGENGVIVKAQLNRKTLQKQVEKMDSFAQWIGVLSGKIESISPEGVIELDAAGVTVFEKKQKAVTESESFESQTPENNASSTEKPQFQEQTKRVFRLVK